jgi:hypothetical protein
MSQGKFSDERMRAALRTLAERLGLDDRDVQILHMANNAVYALPVSGVVVRITRSTTLHDRVRKSARLGEWFARVDAPTIRLTDSIEQPVVFEDLLGTVWDYLPPGPAPDADDLGRALREFHRLPAPDVDLPTWDPVGTARKRIADAEALEDNDRDVLLEWCELLDPGVQALVDASPGSLVHGDAHAGNLLRRPDGRVVFCDFDSTCIGPSRVDLAALAAGAIWFGASYEHTRLARSYGYDITTDPDWPVLRQARELAFIVGGVPLLASSPGVAEQFKLRLTSVNTGDSSTTWTPYAAFGKSSE